MRLENLIVRDQVGAGSLGEVFSANDEDGNPFAVKFFHAITPSAALISAINQANALMRVRHPAVVRIHKFEPICHPVRKSIEYALVMDRVLGVPLSQPGAAITKEHAFAAIWQLCHGLQAIHSEGLIHGDLHLGNIILTPTGAKIIDLAYTIGASSSASSTPIVSSPRSGMNETEDLSDLAKVCVELCYRAGLERQSVDRIASSVTHQSAPTALSILELFLALDRATAGSIAPSQQAATPADDHAPRMAGDELDLVVYKLESWAMSHVTRLVSNGRVVGAYPGVLFAYEDALFEIEARTAEVTLIPEALLEEFRDGAVIPESRRMKKHISDPHLRSSSPGAPALRLASDEATSQFDGSLFNVERSISIQGHLGPFLFVEQTDWLYAGGAHDDATHIASVFDVRTGERRSSVLDESAKQRASSREGAVAKAIFKYLRADAAIEPDELGVQLVSARPYAQLEGPVEMKLRLLFSTAAAFNLSDERWSSYSISEEVTALSAPALVAPFTDLPFRLHTAMRTAGGMPIGWSSIARTHPAFARIEHLFDTSR